MALKLKIIDKTHQVAVQPDMPLVWVLRDVLGLTGTKFGCGIAQLRQARCGARPSNVRADEVASRRAQEQ